MVNKANIIWGVFLLITGVALLAGVVVLFLYTFSYNKTHVALCTEALTLRPNEQMYCRQGFIIFDWKVEYERAANGLIKVYYLKNNDYSKLSLGTRSSFYSSSLSLNKNYFLYNFSVTHSATLALNAICDNSTSSSAFKVYILKSIEYDECVKKYGAFYEGMFTADLGSCAEAAARTHVFDMPYEDYYYLIFSSNSSTGVSFAYDINMTYSIYNLSGLKDQTCSSDNCNCKDECKYHLDDGDYIFVDYPSTKNNRDIVDVRIRDGYDLTVKGILGMASVAVLMVLAFISSVLCFKDANKPQAEKDEVTPLAGENGSVNA